MSFKKIALVACSALFVFSCDKKSTPKEDNDLKSFAQFSANLEMPETEACGRGCTYKKKEFRYLAYVGEKIYCYWDEKQAEHGVDFKAKAEELEATITNSMTETQYYLLLQKWASLFRDGHVNPMMGSDLSEMELFSSPVRLEMITPGTDHEKLIVSQVGEEVKNLRPGTVVEKIQGQPWQSYLPAAEALSMGSTQFMRHRQMANLIIRVLQEQEGAKPITIEGTYRGQPVSETVARRVVLYDGSTEPDEDTTGIELIKTAILPNNIGYLRIDGFSGTKMPELLAQAMQRLKNTNALLLDVRANGGGDLSGNTVISYLAKTEVMRFKQRAVYSDFMLAFRPGIAVAYDYTSGRFTNMVERMVEPADMNYDKPVAVLTGPSCFSACDTFTSALKENKLATVLGENTGGGTGNPQVLELPMSGHMFRYSVVQGFTAVGGEYIEGKGTAPDVVIEPTVEDRADKVDRQLEKSLAWLAEKAALPAPTVPSTLLQVDVKSVSDIPLEVELDKEIKRSQD
ncbi:MAG: hypothetical protein K0R29_2894 [Pseudobdellovibrio sp.]|nr:hypothetical protein [Pseudobdellovibrio sp.]